MTSTRRANRGPSAAAGNRAALVAAARQIFVTVGFDAPLSLVVRTAGVGQGSLYRHFPDRESLVLAVLEESMRGLEDLAGTPGTTLDDILAAMVEQLVGSIAFVAMLDPQLNPRNRDPRLADMSRRMSAVLAGAIGPAHADGDLRAGVDVDDLMLAVAMFASVLSRTDAEVRPQVAARAWGLLLHGLRD